MEHQHGSKAEDKQQQSDTRPTTQAAHAEPAHTLKRLQQTIGNRAVGRLLQAKLQGGQPQDAYEQEADRAAEAVLRLPDSAPAPIVTGQAARALAPARDSSGQRGQPLPASVREFFEPRFGYDFSGVRVHTDGAAAEMAHGLRAAAFTVGQDIVFGAARFAPQTNEGRRLLAHELTHTVQQRSMPHSAPVVQRQALAEVAVPSRLATDSGEPPALQAAINGGWRGIARLERSALQRATVAERLEMLRQLVEAYWTGGREEEAIIRIIETTPAAQAAELVSRLTVETVGGRTYLAALDKVVDLGNNADLHVALSQLRLNGLEPQQKTTALASAPILPWYDTITKDVTFKVSRTPDGSVRLQYRSSAFNQHVAIGRYTNFTDEFRRLPPDIWGSGHTYEPNQPLVIHDYETNKQVTVMAQELVGIEHQYIRSFLVRAAVTTAISAAPFVAEAVPAVGWFFSDAQLASGLSSVATNLLGQALNYGTEWDRYNLQSIPSDYALAVAGNQLAGYMFDKIPAALPLAKLDPGGKKIVFDWFARRTDLWSTWAKNFGKQQVVFFTLTNFVAVLRAWTADINMWKNLKSANISNATSALKSIAEQTFLSTDVGRKWFPAGRKSVSWVILNRMIDQIWKTAIQVVTGAVAGTGKAPAPAGAGTSS